MRVNTGGKLRKYKKKVHSQRVYEDKREELQIVGRHITRYIHNKLWCMKSAETTPSVIRPRF